MDTVKPVSLLDPDAATDSETYGLEGLLIAAGQHLGEEITPRTVRLYATQGLIDRPGKEGRSAIYGRRQLLQLLLIRSLSRRGLSLSAIAPLAVLANDQLEQQLAQLDSNTDESIDASLSLEEPANNEALDYLQRLKQDSASDEYLSDDDEVESSRSLIPFLGAPLSSSVPKPSRSSSRSASSRAAASRWHRFNLAPGVELHINDSVSIPPAGRRRLNWLQRLADRLIEQLDEGKS